MFLFYLIYVLNRSQHLKLQINSSLEVLGSNLLVKSHIVKAKMKELH